MSPITLSPSALSSRVRRSAIFPWAPAGRLRLTFADGLVGELDVLDRMRGPVFADARSERGFAQVHVDPESGTITWPGGADLAPDVLYEQIRSRLAA